MPTFLEATVMFSVSARDSSSNHGVASSDQDDGNTLSSGVMVVDKVCDGVGEKACSRVGGENACVSGGCGICCDAVEMKVCIGVGCDGCTSGSTKSWFFGFCRSLRFLSFIPPRCPTYCPPLRIHAPIKWQQYPILEK
ncbi:hypothetical protein PF008_g7253 [Phytophthora fragariae]|uniref:Uncharacterized protein n=1 Tax=Phytophthora fragariae TaxID=53985 RepID=A0A6G0S420_9STRA|nr:hypothetical protein PF008_g7253 [Phytophthora fragariae]